MNKKIFIFISFLALILFIGLFTPQKASAQCGDGYPECVNDCTACWVNSDCSYGGCWEDTNCGNCYVPPPPPACEPFTECRSKTYSDNWCCNNVDQNWTPNPKGNNVCNWEYSWYWTSNCECVRRGDADSRGHGCATRPACGVCIAGQTQTNTRPISSCATSTCGGGNQACAQEVTRQEQTLTCNSVCGGWTVTQDWHDVDSYPECPANNECGTSSQSGSSCYSPPGHTHRYSCVDNSCTHTDDLNGSTDPNCGGTCTVVPPPPQKYACSGGACVVNANGPYTASNCNNACSVPPGGCSVSWTLSNENPQPNSSIQVKIRGLSDPNGWPNVQLWMDGSSNNVGSWGGIENPWPTFVYNNVPTRSSGGHTLEFRTNNGSRTCAPSKTFTTQNPCDQNYYNDKTHVCYFTGTNPDTGNFLSQHDDPVSFEHDWGTGQVNSTGRSDGVSAIWRGKVNFTSGSYIFHARSDDGVRLDLEGYGTIIPRSGAPNSWVDQPPTTHDSAIINLPAGYRNITLRWYENGGGAYIRLWWEKQPPQNLSVNKPSCSDTAYPVTLNWQNTNDVLKAEVDQDGDWGDKFYNKDVGNQISTPAPAGFNGAAGLTGLMPNFNPGQTYFWRLWNGSTQTYGGGWNVPLCLGAWIQTIGGDVHSNGKIRMGGGP